MELQGPRLAALGAALVAAAAALLAAGLLIGSAGLDGALIATLRAPRVLAAAGVGALLALSGLAMQVLLRNPLADPYVLGTSGGASVGALLALLAGAMPCRPRTAQPLRGSPRRGAHRKGRRRARRSRRAAARPG